MRRIWVGEIAGRRFGAFVVIGALILAPACGGDDDVAGADPVPADQPNDPGEDADDADDGAGIGAGDNESIVATAGTCAGLSVNGTSPGNDVFSATSAAAVSLEDGRAYTMYLADFELTLDDVSAFGTPTVPEGGTMFTVAVTVFNAPDPDALQPLAPGQVIEYTGEFEVLTFVVTGRDDAGIHGNSMGAEGTLEITGSGGTFCGTVTYTDGEKSLTGTFESPAKPV